MWVYSKTSLNLLSHDKCQNQLRKRVLGILQFPDAATVIPRGHRIGSKNRYPLRNNIIPNLATIGATGTTCPGPGLLPHQELCDFTIGMGSCHIP